VATDSTLHKPGADSIGWNFTYTNANVIYQENGRIHAVLIVNGKPVSDWIQVIILPPSSVLLKAVTRDINGNGLIDRIDLSFDKRVPLTSAIWARSRSPTGSPGRTATL